MENPTDSFLEKVERMARASVRLRAMLNRYGGYNKLPVDYQVMVRKAIEKMDSHWK